MHGTLFLFSLFSPGAHAEEEVDSCPDICEACIVSMPEIDETDDTCCIHTDVTLNRGCDIELEDRPLHIGSTGSLTIQGDTTIQASRVRLDDGGTLKADCDSVSCGETLIRVSDSSEFHGTINYSGSLSMGSFGSSIRIQMADGAEGDVTFGTTSNVNLNGRTTDGVAGDLTIEASNVTLSGITTLQGSPADKGTAGTLSIQARGTEADGSGNIVIDGTIVANGDVAGAAELLAANLITSSANISIRTGNNEGIAGTFIARSTTINLGGDLNLMRNGSSRGPGGKAWIDATETAALTGTVQLMGGGSGASSGPSGTLRLDGGTLMLNGNIYSRGASATPYYGGRISAVATDQINVAGTVQMHGDQTGGSIELVAMNNVTITGTLETGEGASGLIAIQSRNGSVLLGGHHKANGSPMDATTPSFRIDGCKLSFTDDVRLTAPDYGAIALSARSYVATDRTPSDDDNPWIAMALAGEAHLDGTHTTFTYPDPQLAPDIPSFYSNFIVLDPTPVTIVEPSLKRCVPEERNPNDEDGDGYNWERLGSGADCDDADALISPDGMDIDADGIDQNCDCDPAGTVLPHAYATWVPHWGESIDPACDGEDPSDPGDADGGPGEEPVGDSGEPTPDTAVPDTAPPGSDEFGVGSDTGLPTTKYDYGDPVAPCGCAQTNGARSLGWAFAVLVGIAARRRHG